MSAPASRSWAPPIVRKPRRWQPNTTWFPDSPTRTCQHPTDRTHDVGRFAKSPYRTERPDKNRPIGPLRNERKCRCAHACCARTLRSHSPVNIPLKIGRSAHSRMNGVVDAPHEASAYSRSQAFALSTSSPQLASAVAGRQDRAWMRPFFSNGTGREPCDYSSQVLIRPLRLALLLLLESEPGIIVTGMSDRPTGLLTVVRSLAA